MEIPISNVYYLLCYAWNKLEESDTIKIDPTQSTDLINLFARVLISGVTHLLKKGFDRGYIVHSEETKVLRGRIQFQPTLKRGLLLRAQAHCEFDELSYDVLHNRILKTTLSRLIRADGIDSLQREQLGEHWHNMPEVGTVDLSSQVFGKVQLYRNNHLYDFLLRVCELLHVNLLPTEKPGAWRFRSFLQDSKQMAALFEQFVRNFYKREAWRVFPSGPVAVGREDIHWKFTTDNLEFARLLPKMQTDVCITTGARKILIECKYTSDPLEAERYEGTQKLISGHLFQVNSYLDNLPDSHVNNCCEAILLYPMAKHSIEAEYRRSKGQKVSIRTINLFQEWKGVAHDMLLLVS
jgi:5-methylcytosine-specific restriction enzyme subunit McrC